MIDGHTILYGLLAHPAAHSLSPLIHNTSFQETGINGTYLAFDVTPDHLSESIAGIRAMHIGGVNLSMPLKTDVIPLLDRITPRAKRLNAVNTIVNRDGQLLGDTTDGQGLVDALRFDGIQLADTTVTVLGAGGAGRSVISAAVDAGAARVIVFKRQNTTFDQRKQQLTAWSKTIQVKPYEDEAELVRAIQESQVVVNTTNIGMGDDPRLPVSPEVLQQLGPSQVVVDAVYFPLETPFVRAAKQRGCRTFNGIGMLVHQAAGAFLEWTGRQMPIDVVMNAVNQAVAIRENTINR